MISDQTHENHRTMTEEIQQYKTLKACGEPQIIHENSACCTGNHNAHWEGKCVIGGEVKCLKEIKDVANIT